ncbi:phospholipase-like protein [Tanacetum coccineum]
MSSPAVNTVTDPDGTGIMKTKKYIKNMTIAEYVEYEARMKRQNMHPRMCEDADFNCLRRDIPSKFLPCQLPPKELNLGSFTLPCIIGSLNLYAMADLGASVNVMPKSIFEHLKLANLKETDMLVEMADMTRKALLGILENILIKINKFLFPSNFIIINMLGEPSETMILGRPFLATIYTKIDVFIREISLGIREDRVLFDMDGGMYHSKILVEKQCTRFCNDENIETVDSSDKSGYDAIYGQGEHGMLKQWMCFRDNERQSVGGNHMIFADFFKEDQILNIKTYFPEFSQPQPSKPWPRDYSYEEWLRIKLGHTNVSKSVRNTVLNECVLDSFDIEADYERMRDDPYSRRFDEYKRAFYNEIEQLANKYDLRIGFKEEERWESGIEKINYEPPFVDIETFDINSKKIEFEIPSAHIHVVKMLLFRHNHSSYAVTRVATA